MLTQVIAKYRSLALRQLERVRWVAPLVGRWSVGLLFLSTGWGKVHSLDKVTAFFVTLGIPAPGLNAVVVGYSELICGTLLTIGLFTRLATLPLIVSMVVAILSAKLHDIHGLFDLVAADEFTYLCVLVMLFIIGPGRLSVDAILAGRLFGDDRT